MKRSKLNRLPCAPLARGISGSVLLALLLAGCSQSRNGAVDSPVVPAANTAPGVLNLVDLAGPQDTVIGPVAFNVTDNESNPIELRVSAGVADAKLFPSGSVVVGGSGGVRQLTLMPAEELFGNTTLTVTVTDPQGLMTSRTVAVAVRAVPASILAVSTGAFAKGVNDAPTVVNGFTFVDDANDPAVFDTLIESGAQ